MDPQHEFWLQTIFQNIVEVSLQLNNSSTPEETPYIYKYEAIDKLKQLAQKPHNLGFIVECILGELYNEVDQTSDSVRSYQAALQSYSLLPEDRAGAFVEYLIVIYNMLGLSYVNREELEEGLGCLIKAQQVYNYFSANKGEDVYHNRSFPSKDRRFAFFYEGGNDHQQIEDSYTLTLFYLAQAYTKMQLKDRAALYCGETLKRQYANSKYELKDFCLNLIGLAEYYQGTKNFAQSQYILMLALKILPEGQKAKLRATVQTSLGNLLCQILDFSCLRIANADISEKDNEVVGRKMLIFQQFDQQFPNVVLPTDLEGCKVLFRQANTQIKKALEVYVLDGFVTEHIDLLFAQSKLYKSLGLVEKSVERKISMMEKRKQFLQPLLKELNPKAFPATWQRILVEVADVTNEVFIAKLALMTVKNTYGDDKVTQSSKLGVTLIGYYEKILQALYEDKDSEKNEQYYRSIINSLINIAKTKSRILSLDRKERVEHMKDSWKKYQGVLNYIEQKLPANLRAAFEKEYELTKEVIALMPSKIDRINYGQMNIIE